MSDVLTAEHAGSVDEPPIDPAREIVDPHHHLWEIPAAPGSMQAPQRFLLHEFLDTLARSGHNFTHSVFVECHSMYRAAGPAAFRQVGETEFVNGIAAMSASGNYGPCRIAAGIVGTADPRLGERIAPVLEAHVTAGGGRFRGVRFMTAYSEAGMFGMPCDPGAKGVMMEPAFRESVGVLEKMGLSLDIWCFHTQLDEVIDLATACPGLTIVLDHVGTPESLGAYAGRKAEARAEWESRIVELAKRPNVVVKLGGLGMDLSKTIGRVPGTTPSSTLAAGWRPYIETCVDTFAPQRCMFESNFPPDSASCSYGALWNAFKRISQNHSADEKTALFSGTAKKIYRLD